MFHAAGDPWSSPDPPTWRYAAGTIQTKELPPCRKPSSCQLEVRPDDLTATVVRAALDQVPELDPATVDVHYLGCGMPRR